MGPVRLYKDMGPCSVCGARFCSSGLKPILRLETDRKDLESQEAQIIGHCIARNPGNIACNHRQQAFQGTIGSTLVTRVHKALRRVHTTAPMSTPERKSKGAGSWISLAG